MNILKRKHIFIGAIMVIFGIVGFYFGVQYSKKIQNNKSYKAKMFSQLCRPIVESNIKVILANNKLFNSCLSAYKEVQNCTTSEKLCTPQNLGERLDYFQSQQIEASKEIKEANKNLDEIFSNIIK